MKLDTYAIVPLALVVIVAATTVTIVWIALRGTASQDRPGILHAVAEMIHAMRRN